MKRIGLMGGSFNPVHIGHLMIASYVRQTCELDEVWLMLSPLNPLKANNMEIADDKERMNMLRLACEKQTGVIPCDIELSLPRPSFTIDTLRHLKERYPEYEFSLIIGGDNWSRFDLWKNHKEILSSYNIYVYPRPGEILNSINLPSSVTIVNGPGIDLSASFIRKSIQSGIDISVFLPLGVSDYIKNHYLYILKN